MHGIVRSLALALLALAWASPVRADDIGDKLEAASSAYGHGDLLHALEAVQSARTLLTGRLVDLFAKTLPPPPAGWDTAPAESQPLDQIGGGLTITRGFQKGDSTLNASLLIDNPAVANIVSLFQPGSPPPEDGGTWKTVAVGGETALLRFDSANREGEVVMAVQGRAALQIEGSEIDDENILVGAARGWNLALLKKLLGS